MYATDPYEGTLCQNYLLKQHTHIAYSVRWAHVVGAVRKNDQTSKGHTLEYTAELESGKLIFSELQGGSGNS